MIRKIGTLCLLFIYDKLWAIGIFHASWKLEVRAVLEKHGKDEFHSCDAYRTVSLTDILGKKYEKITARRLVSVLEELGFDMDQYAYLQGRSSTQALTFITERISRGLASLFAPGVISVR